MREEWGPGSDKGIDKETDTEEKPYGEVQGDRLRLSRDDFAWIIVVGNRYAYGIDADRQSKKGEEGQHGEDFKGHRDDHREIDRCHDYRISEACPFPSEPDDEVLFIDGTIGLEVREFVDIKDKGNKEPDGDGGEKNCGVEPLSLDKVGAHDTEGAKEYPHHQLSHSPVAVLDRPCSVKVAEKDPCYADWKESQPCWNCLGVVPNWALKQLAKYDWEEKPTALATSPIELPSRNCSKDCCKR